MNNFDAYVRSNVPNVSGLCQQQFQKSTFFGHPQTGRVDNFKIRCNGLRVKHTAFCRRFNLINVALKNCVMDRCQGLGRRAEEKIFKTERHEKKSYYEKNETTSY